MLWLAHLFFTMTVANAQEGYLGIQAGLTDSTGPYVDKQVAFSGGGRAGVLFYDRIALGALTHYYVSREPTQNISYQPILAELLYYPYRTPHDSNNFYVGAGFGTTHLVISDFSGRRTDNATTVALEAGYAIMLWSNVNIGPEFQYFLVYSSEGNFHLTSPQLALRIFF